MIKIIAGIKTLSKHLEKLKSNRDDYCPSSCKKCCGLVIHSHGCYYRKASRDSHLDDADNPIPIPRFRCKGCGITFSCLPECIPPRRWYTWSVQEEALSQLLTLKNFTQGAKKLVPSRRTLSRWWDAWKRDHPVYADLIQAQYPTLGRLTAKFGDFWRTCLSRFTLANVMRVLYNQGAPVPSSP